MHICFVLYLFIDVIGVYRRTQGYFSYATAADIMAGENRAMPRETHNPLQVADTSSRVRRYFRFVGFFFQIEVRIFKGVQT